MAAKSVSQTQLSGQAIPTIPAGQTTVLTSDELSRIRTTLLHADAKTSGTQILSEEERLRLQLRDMSKQRMSTWNNTLEARRRQKEQARQAKIDEEERRRQVLDKEEAAYQASERKKAIQRANTLLFENTERVKAFGSKLYISDVLKEREMQKQIRDEIEERKLNEERLWHERIMEAVRVGDQEEEKRRQEALQRALHSKQVQLEQLEEFRVKYVTQKREERREGQLIKQRVEAYIEAEKEAEMKKKMDEMQRAKQTLQENKRLEDERRISDQRAAENEERRMAQFAEEKERKMRLRAEREAEVAAHKAAIRQRMVDRQVAHLMALRKNENERIAGQVREAEEKRDAEISAKNERLRQELEKIRLSHAAQKKELEMQRERERQADAEDAARLLSEYQAATEAERENDAARRGKNISLKKYHVKQIHDKMRRAASEKVQELEEQADLRAQLAEEERLFEQYSEALIAQYRADGKDVKPLLMELARIKSDRR